MQCLPRSKPGSPHESARGQQSASRIKLLLLSHLLVDVDSPHRLVLHPPVLLPLQRASGGQAVEEEVWEHQRFFPVRGWTSTLPTERKRFARNEDGSGSQHKFPQVDPPEGRRQRLSGGSVHVDSCLSASRQWPNKAGRCPCETACSHASAMTPVLITTHSALSKANASTSSSVLVIHQQPTGTGFLPSGWEWEGPWQVETGPHMDREGWMYAPDFGAMDWPPLPVRGVENTFVALAFQKAIVTRRFQVGHGPPKGET